MCTEKKEELSAHTSDLYIAGLQAIAAERGISPEEAAQQIAKELRENGAGEHVEPTFAALSHIQSSNE